MYYDERMEDCNTDLESVARNKKADINSKGGGYGSEMVVESSDQIFT